MTNREIIQSYADELAGYRRLFKCWGVVLTPSMVKKAKERIAWLKAEIKDLEGAIAMGADDENPLAGWCVSTTK